jgi:hypothetical protein
LLSRFIVAESKHLIKFGLKLSKNHPLLSDEEYWKDCREKFGLDLTISGEHLQVSGSMTSLEKFFSRTMAKLLSVEDAFRSPIELDN